MVNNNERHYKSVLVSFMQHRDGVMYDKNAVFAQEQLGNVKADEIFAWFNHCAYGCIDPTPDDRPKQYHSNSLFWKKALSSLMPNRNHQWNEIMLVGNPTRLQAVNDMIAHVKKSEGRQQGALSKAQWPLKDYEFRSVLGELRGTDEDLSKYGIPAVMAFQFHLIGWLDDCCKWLKINLKPHDAYPDMAFKAKLCWGKNVQEERDVPWQHVFGCLDWIYCCILNVGLWLEIFHSTVHNGRLRPFVFAFSDEHHDEEVAARQCKSKVYIVLWHIFGEISAEIVNDDDDEDKLDTHSIRKYASTYSCQNGISCDDKDHHGHWKHICVSDRHNDIELDYIDAKVASVLCPSGICNCVCLDPACTEQWICMNVIPNIHGVFGETIAALFGRAILWFFHSDYKDLMLANTLLQIQTAYEATQTINNDQNPMEQRPIIVSGEEKHCLHGGR